MRLMNLSRGRRELDFEESQLWNPDHAPIARPGRQQIMPRSGYRQLHDSEIVLALPLTRPCDVGDRRWCTPLCGFHRWFGPGTKKGFMIAAPACTDRSAPVPTNDRARNKVIQCTNYYHSRYTQDTLSFDFLMCEFESQNHRMTGQLTL